MSSDKHFIRTRLFLPSFGEHCLYHIGNISNSYPYHFALISILGVTKYRRVLLARLCVYEDPEKQFLAKKTCSRMCPMWQQFVEIYLRRINQFMKYQ